MWTGVCEAATWWEGGHLICPVDYFSSLSHMKSLRHRLSHSILSLFYWGCGTIVQTDFITGYCCGLWSRWVSNMFLLSYRPNSRKRWGLGTTLLFFLGFVCSFLKEVMLRTGSNSRLFCGHILFVSHWHNGHISPWSVSQMACFSRWVLVQSSALYRVSL